MAGQAGRDSSSANDCPDSLAMDRRRLPTPCASCCGVVSRPRHASAPCDGRETVAQRGPPPSPVFPASIGRSSYSSGTTRRTDTNGVQTSAPSATDCASLGGVSVVPAYGGPHGATQLARSGDGRDAALLRHARLARLGGNRRRTGCARSTGAGNRAGAGRAGIGPRARVAQAALQPADGVLDSVSHRSARAGVSRAGRSATARLGESRPLAAL